MRKFLLAFAAVTSLSLMTSSMALAEGKIDTNVYRIDLNLRLYEVCGTVSGLANNSNLAVDMQVDPGKYEGHYVTHTNKDGRFCQIIRVIGTGLNLSVDGVTASVRVEDAISRNSK